jgi:hypothetical protein
MAARSPVVDDVYANGRPVARPSWPKGDRTRSVHSGGGVTGWCRYTFLRSALFVNSVPMCPASARRWPPVP